MIARGTLLERQADGRVLVEVDRGTACDGCHSQGHCSMGFGERKARVTALDATGAQVGQRVTLELDDVRFLSACAWVYLVPLAGLVLGAGLAWWAFGAAGARELRDVASALFALAGTAAGLGLVWQHDRKVRGGRDYEVRVRAGEWTDESGCGDSTRRR